MITTLIHSDKSLSISITQPSFRCSNSKCNNYSN